MPGKGAGKESGLQGEGGRDGPGWCYSLMTQPHRQYKKNYPKTNLKNPHVAKAVSQRKRGSCGGFVWRTEETVFRESKTPMKKMRSLNLFRCQPQSRAGEMAIELYFYDLK